MPDEIGDSESQATTDDVARDRTLFGGPPRAADAAPVMTRATSTAATVPGIRNAWGGSRIAINGRSAPTVKATADQAAACHEFVRSVGSIPAPRRRARQKASRSVSSSATARAVAVDTPLASYSASSTAAGSSLSSPRYLFSSACSVSRQVLTEAYSPSAIETAPAARPATPTVRIGPGHADAAATPTTMPAVETIPSLARNTAAREQFGHVSTPRMERGR